MVLILLYSRFMLSEQAKMVKVFHGKGDLEPITGDEETL